MPSDHKTQLQRDFLRVSRRIHVLLSEKTTDSTYHTLVLCIISACWANLPSLIILPADCGFFLALLQVWWKPQQTCIHPHPSAASTDQRGNAQVKALHAGAAFSSYIWIDVLKKCGSPHSGDKSDPQSSFTGASPSQVPVEMWSKKGAPSSADSTPDYSRGLSSWIDALSPPFHSSRQDNPHNKVCSQLMMQHMMNNHSYFLFLLTFFSFFSEIS